MYKDIAQNKRKSFFIMFFFFLFVAFIIFLFVKFLNGNFYIFYIGLFSALIYIVLTYYFGSSMALAINRATPIVKSQNPRLYKIVENLAITDGLPTPKIYIINDPALNAFATGRDPNHASITVTSGLLEVMNDQELQGVISHEMSHIKNFDIRVSMIAFALSAIISILADIIIQIVWLRDDNNNSNNQAFLYLGIVAAILAPIVAMFIQLAISRQREYLADASGALATRYPEGLASALEKIGKYGSRLKVQNTATAHLFISNPLGGHSLTNLFSTHPPLKDRIKRLRAMESNG